MSTIATVAGPAETIVVLHIPRTGGTTLRAMLARSAPDRAIAFLYPRSAEWGERGGEKHPMRRQTRATLHDLHEGRVGPHAVVIGHFGSEVFARVDGPVRGVAVVREPVDRVISQYHHIVTGHAAKAWWREEGTSGDIGIEAFVQHPEGAEYSRNLITRRIAGLDDGIGGDYAHEDILDRALQRLRSDFLAVGDTAHLEIAARLICDHLGWALWRPKRRLNENPQRPAREALPATTRTLIADLNALDIRLHAAVSAVTDGGRDPLGITRI